MEKMDLASLASIKAAVERLQKTVTKIDILINNAGVMMCPFVRTEDGFEMQIGTNHFGHFYLTNLLLPLIKKAAPGARIVTVSSLAHKRGNMQWRTSTMSTQSTAPRRPMVSQACQHPVSRELANRLRALGSWSTPSTWGYCH